SPRCTASSSVAGRRGSCTGPTTWARCRHSTERSASSWTGRSRCSSAARWWRSERSTVRARRGSGRRHRRRRGGARPSARRARPRTRPERTERKPPEASNFSGMETEPAPTDADVRTGVAARLHDVLRRLFGQEAPVRIRAWDGPEAGPTDAPVGVVRERRAVRRLLWRPDELGLARGLIAGEIETQGPLLDTLERLAPYARTIGARPELTVADRAELLRTAAELGAVGPQPKPPPEEVVGRARDRESGGS